MSLIPSRIRHCDDILFHEKINKTTTLTTSEREDEQRWSRLTLFSRGIDKVELLAGVWPGSMILKGREGGTVQI